MLIVGLTGGIASGKTTVSDAFAELGAPVIDTDLIAREVVEPGQPGLDRVCREFGSGVLTAEGHLDRAELRRIVFADPSARHRLEGILHPLIRQTVLERLASVNAPYAIVVVPLLVETGFDSIVDRILVVDAPVELQRRRLARRDGSSPEEIERILSSQASREHRAAKAHDVIVNDGDLDRVHEQVRTLHDKYMGLGGNHRN